MFIVCKYCVHFVIRGGAGIAVVRTFLLIEERSVYCVLVVLSVKRLGGGSRC